MPRCDDATDISDPCQVPVIDPATKSKRICGEIHPTLRHHLKKHKRGNGKKWTVDEYKKAFPEFSLGQKYIPPKSTHDKFVTSSPIYQDRVAIKEKNDAEEKVESDSMDSKVKDRFVELWDQVNRDVAVRQFAMEAARCEVRLEEINKRFDIAFRKGEYQRMNDLTAQIAQQQKLLKDMMNFLDLSVKTRREKNQLGNDSVAQLVSNYAGTLRRMSPERREIFDNRVRETREYMKQRLREKTLYELTDEHVVDSSDEPVEPKTESDYDGAIIKYIEGVKL